MQIVKFPKIVAEKFAFYSKRPILLTSIPALAHEEREK